MRPTTVLRNPSPFVLLLTLALMPVATLFAAKRGVWLVRDQLFRVSEDGSSSKLTLAFDNRFAEAGYGNQIPVLSPDGKTLAFVKEDALWLSDISTGKVREALPRVAGRTILMRAWSHDSRQIVLTRPSQGAGTAAPDFLVLDVRKSQLKPVQLAGLTDPRLHAWVGDNELIVTGRASDGTPVLQILSLKTGTARILSSAKGPFGDIVSDKRGRALIVERRTDSSSQLVQIDTRKNQATDLTPEGGFGEYGAPRFTDDGRTSYIRSKAGTHEFVVASASVFTCTTGLSAEWISSKTALIWCGSDAIVFDTDEKTEKGRVGP